MNFISQSRRDFLSVGAVGGLSLPFLLQNEAFSAQKFYESKEGVAKNVIHVYLLGGIICSRILEFQNLILRWNIVDHLMLLILQYLDFNIQV